MKCIVLEILNWHCNGYKDEVIARYEVTADTREELFKKVYKFKEEER